MEQIKTIMPKKFEEIEKLFKRVNKKEKWKKSGFTMVKNRILISKNLKSTTLRIYLIILMHSFKKGESFPSHDTISKEVGFKKRQSVIPHTKKLEKLGYIEKEKRPVSFG